MRPDCYVTCHFLKKTIHTWVIIMETKQDKFMGFTVPSNMERGEICLRIQEILRENDVQTFQRLSSMLLLEMNTGLLVEGVK